MVLGVWISDLHGDNMRMVAQDPVPDGVKWSGEIQFLPDDSTVSYCLDDDIYTLVIGH